MNTEPNETSATLERERDILRAEVEDLRRERDEERAENDRLRAAIQRAEDAEKQLLEVAQIVHENSHPQQLRARLFNLLMRHMPDGPKT